MSIEDWKYYNHAMIPSTAPHIIPDLTPVRDGSIWQNVEGKKPLLVRWTENFDCKYETNWWYIIQDRPFDLAEIKAKRRYEINKGLKNFHILRISDPNEYASQLFEIAHDAYLDYPDSYRPEINREGFIKSIQNWNTFDLYGAFTNDTNDLVAFAMLIPHEDYSDFAMMKAMRIHEKAGVNAALIFGVLEGYKDRFVNGYYICDGARSINHESAFQDYLEKYFLFRKAYCSLKIEYSRQIRYYVRILYPFRKLLIKMDKIGAFHQINSILKMEEIARQE